MEIIITIFATIGAVLTGICVYALILAFCSPDEPVTDEELRHLNATQWALYQTQLTGSSQPIKGNNLSLILK